MMNYFSFIYGLITRADPTTENGGLFFAHYLVLKKMLKIPFTRDDTEHYLCKMDAAFVSTGLYKRSLRHTQRTVSQDEQSGFSIASHLLGLNEHKEIWSYLVKHKGNYPATGTIKFYNPGSYYAWAVLADSKFSFIFAPWYLINLLISSNKVAGNTSSKLVYMSELYCLKERSFFASMMWEYFHERMELMYGDRWVKALIDIYFGMEDLDHPLRELSRRL